MKRKPASARATEGPSELNRSPARLNSRALAVENSAAEASRGAPPRQLLMPHRDSLFFDAELVCVGHGGRDRLVVHRSGRDHEHRRLAKPDVQATPPVEFADSR